MADKLILRSKRSTQLNEKVSTSQYDILYPETIAEQVITNDNRMFVTKEQIDAWTKGQGSLHFRGEWKTDKVYVAGDMVEYQGYMFISGVDHTSTSGYVPRTDLPQTIYNKSIVYWNNVDYISNLSEKAREVKTESTTGVGKYFLTFVDSNNPVGNSEDSKFEQVYTNIGIAYEPADETLIVKRLQGKADFAGTADEAKHAVEADHALKADDAINADTAVNYKNTKDPYGKTNIQKTIEGINDRIDGITDGTGGAVLSNGLYIQKNGAPLNGDPAFDPGFTGFEKQVVNITIEPADVKGLLTPKNKIDNKWLPDDILGNLKYMGTVNEDGIVTSFSPELDGKNIDTISPRQYVGIYFLAAFKDPKAAAKLAGIDDVRVGDWLVSNGSKGWVKIDNTDAVTMVNSQTGAVETYKKDWQTNSHYYVGDIVKWQNALYITKKEHDTYEEFIESNYDIFGKLYTATDGIKLEGTVFKHINHKKEGTSEDHQLTWGDIMTVATQEHDAFGHLIQSNLTNFKMPPKPEDTWRPVYIDDVMVLKPNSIEGSPLTFVGNNDVIKVTFDNSSINVKHVSQNNDAGEFIPTGVKPIGTGEIKLDTGDGFVVPKFKYDIYGHISGIEYKTMRLPISVISVAHKHFDVTKDNTSGLITIKAFEDPGAGWVSAKINENKFYTGEQVPASLPDTPFFNIAGSFTGSKLFQVKDGKRKQVIDETLTVNSGLNLKGTAIVGTYNLDSDVLALGDSGVNSKTATYSAVAVNPKGIVVGGGAILEFGHIVQDHPENNEPSTSLAVGGLFFREMIPQV